MLNSSYLAKLFKIFFHKANVKFALLLLIVGLIVVFNYSRYTKFVCQL